MTETSYQRCTNPECSRPMRPRGYTADMAPGTVAMGYRGQCKTCAQPAREPKPRTGRRPVKRVPEDIRTAHTLRGLEAFYARRYARGVPPEATPSIVISSTADVIDLWPSGPAIEYRSPGPERLAA